ncbi:photosystem II manganese-stabilizing polypeptide [Lusitaniella coriacea LEGE 07157]|uniref:Photosystem II extrinsic protein O n=1 Tax=Lusitaniella coriacea LEGE 07157 TaxID=945747 RepID=A0A8J7B2W3_9CYAN|nr:photosystem II manganese-stabilizing polypeptide [Lusitaniella coriacea]MBE9114617.1 photosystem II manganese-stabilizing polypeptide [Lusitaniella coriacea LEGE 07157]
MRYRAFIVAFLAVCLGLLTACSEGPAQATNKEQLTYEQILGTGLANVCPQLSETTRGSFPVEAGKTYALSDLCVEPKTFFVKEEPTSKRKEAEFISGKLLTRYTTSLNQVSGTISVGEDGTLTFKEKAGMDFQPITVQLAGGEQVPFLFTMKDLEAKTQSGLNSINASTDFQGEFNVPSYRGSVFLDPKGRGVASGYDNAVALPSLADNSEFVRANVKQTQIRNGEMSLQVTRVNGDTGEIAGVFESIQPSDTDLGADDPEEVKIQGIFYGIVSPEE